MPKRATTVATVLLLALLALPPAPAAVAQSAVTAERIDGATRYETAAAAARVATGGNATTAVLAGGEGFADALPAATLVGALDAALLLTRPDALPAVTAQTLEDLGVATVLVLGGPAAVSDAVLAQLRGSGLDVERVSGPTRYATAAETARRADAHADLLSRDGRRLAFVVSGVTFADAVSAGAPATAGPVPVLLTRPEALPEETAEAVRDLGVEAVDVVGGRSAVSDVVVAQLAALGVEVRRLAGHTRTHTAAVVAREFVDAGVLGGEEVTLARGDGFADALAAGPLAGSRGGPALLTRDPQTLDQPAADALRDLAPGLIRAVGGHGAIGQAVLDEAVRAAGGTPPDVAVTVEVVATGLRAPWDVVFAGGRTFVSERGTGNVLELTGGGPRVLTTLAVHAESEGGLLGLAASPGFAQDGLLYAYRTTAADNEVVRFPVHQPAALEVVLDGIPRAAIHNGGRMAFGPDGMLYVGTGDAGRTQLAQDRASLAGKVLRVTPAGGVPPGNPFAGSPVWSLGHRNVQGLAFAADGALYATELGPDRDDEINAVVAGGNYGWPVVTGTANDPRFRDPVLVRQPSEASWSGAAVLDHGAIPQWEGDLFAAGLRGRRLWRLPIDDGRPNPAAAHALLVGEHGRLRDVSRAPDGSLWVLTSNTDGRGSPGPQDDRILRLGPPR